MSLARVLANLATALSGEEEVSVTGVEDEVCMDIFCVTPLSGPFNQGDCGMHDACCVLAM